ncbi:hypothetical protein IG631_06424 [Alternaria alternata]|nr:hypothetical protein IG631_06424 [Alternaria alternata]
MFIQAEMFRHRRKSSSYASLPSRTKDGDRPFASIALRSVPAKPREGKKEHLLKVQKSPMRQGEVARSYFPAPRFADLERRQCSPV